MVELEFRILICLLNNILESLPFASIIQILNPQNFRLKKHVHTINLTKSKNLKACVTEN